MCQMPIVCLHVFKSTDQCLFENIKKFGFGWLENNNFRQILVDAATERAD